MRKTPSHIQGMTLVELLVTIAIFASIMLVATIFISNVFSYNTSLSSSYTTAFDTEILLKTMAKEIRGTSPGSDGAYPIQNAATNTLTFFADVTGNGVKTRIRYSYSGTKIFRASLLPSGSPLAYTGSESTTTILNNVRNATSTPVFEYFNDLYDGSQSALPLPVDLAVVHLIKINITLDTDPTKSPNPRTYSTQITLRNLKNN